MSTVSLESDLPLVLSIEAAQAMPPSCFPQSTANADCLTRTSTSNSPMPGGVAISVVFRNAFVTS